MATWDQDTKLNLTGGLMTYGLSHQTIHLVTVFE